MGIPVYIVKVGTDDALAAITGTAASAVATHSTKGTSLSGQSAPERFTGTIFIAKSR